MNNRLYSIQDAANILGVSTKTLRRWDQRGRFVPTRTAGNQRRYTQSQIEEFKGQKAKVKTSSEKNLESARNAAKVAPLFSENEAPKEFKATHSLPPALTGLPSGSFLKNHFLLKHKDEIIKTESQENLEGSESARRRLADVVKLDRDRFKVNPAKIGFVFGILVLFLSFAGAVILVKYNVTSNVAAVVAGLSATKDQFAKFISNLPQISLQIGPRKTDLSFVPQVDAGAVLAATTGQDLLLKINIPVVVGAKEQDASAIFEIASEDKGFLAPRMTEAQVNAINTPAAGLFVYNTDTNHYNMYNGTEWQGVFTSIGDSTTGEAFTETGTSGTSVFFYDADGRGQLTIANLSGVRKYTLPDASGEVSLLGQSISNDELVNSKVTVSAGTNMTGGGAVSLGSSVTLTLKDSIDLSGTLIAGGATTLKGALTVTGATLLNGNVGLGDATSDAITFTGRVAEGSSLIPIGTTGANDLGTSALPWDNVYADNVFAASSGFSGYWQRNSQALSPTNITDDILLGATSTSSAKIAFINIAGGTPTATISANSGNNATTLTGTGVLGTTNMQTLTLGNSTTGNVVIDSGSSAITFSDTASPTTSDGAALGTSALMWSDLFLASGSVVNFNNGDVTLTHASNVLTFAGGNVGFGGQTSPLAELDVTGSASLSANLSLRGSGTAHTFNILDNGSLNFQRSIGGNAGLATSLFFQNDGNVGIGTTAPLGGLDLRSSATVSGGLTFTTTPTIQSTGLQTLTIGGTTTGAISLSPASATPSLFVMNGGNVGIGTVTPTTFKLEIAGIIGPTVGSTHDIGSSAKRFATIYADTGNFTNIAGTVTGGSTSAADWLINSDNATADTEDATLTFERGTPATNVQFKWNSTTKQLSTNTPSFAILPDAGIAFSGTSALIVNQVQAQDILTASASGTTRFVINNSGNVGIQNSTPLTALDVTGSASLSANISLRGSGTAHTFNILDNGSLNFRKSIGGDAGVSNVLYLENSGNIGIGNTAPSALFAVGSTSQFTVSSAGAIVGVGVNSGSGLIQGTGGITVTGTGNINATGTSATNIGNSTGALVIASGGTSSWTNTSGNLTISTATSGTLALDSAGALNVGPTNATSLAIGRSGVTTTVNGTLATTSPDITTSLTTPSTTFSLVNATATTVNLAGAATTLTVGATTGTATIRNATVNFPNATLMGIGNTAPLTALDVTGSASLSANISLRGSGTAHTFNILDNGSLNIQRSIGGDAGVATALYIQNDGNIGIGDSSPSSRFEVGDGTDSLRVSSVGDITFVDADGAASITGPAGGAFSVVAGASRALTLTGNLGSTWSLTSGILAINTTSANIDLSTTTSGDITLTTGAATGLANILTGNLKVGNGTPTITQDGEDTYLEGVLEVDGISTFGGNVGIGITTPLTALDVTGSASLSANISLRGSGTAHTFNILDNGSLNFRKSIGGDAGVSNVLYLENSGNIGIGNTAPSALFAVGSTSQFTVSSAGAIVGVGVNSGSGLIQGTGGITVTGTGNINATGTSATNIGNSTGALVIASGGTSSWTNTSGNLTIQTATSGTMAVDSAGALNVGPTNATSLAIGRSGVTTTVNGTLATTSPDITTSLTTPSTTFSLVNATATTVNLAGAATTLTVGATTGTATIRNATVNFPNATLMGIGNTAPLTALDVTGSASLSANLSLRGSGTAHTFNILDNGSLNFQKSIGGDAGLATQLYLQNSGNVGIGTTSPGRELEVNGNIRLATGGNLEWTDSTTYIEGDGSTDRISFVTSNTEQVRIDSSGRVGIGNTTPLTALDVTGSASLSANLSLRGSGTAHTFNILDNGSLNIQRSIGGDAGVATALYIQNDGNIGIGDSSPSSRFEVGDGTDSLRVSSVGDITFVDADGAASITGPAGGAFSVVAGASQALTLTANAASTWTIGNGGILQFANGNNRIEMSGTVMNFMADGVNRFLVQGETDPIVDVMIRTMSGVSGEVRHFRVDTRTVNFSSGTQLSAFRKVSIGQDTFQGVNGGAAESVTDTTTFYIAGAPITGADITLTNSYALWVDAGTTRLDGNVGIGGQTAPLTELDVTGSASLSANLSLRGSGTAHTFNILDNGSLNFQKSIGGDAGVATQLYLQNSGNVGIGTTSPTSKLHVVSAAAGTFFTATTGYHLFDVTGTIPSNAILEVNDAGNAGNDLVRLKRNGNNYFAFSGGGAVASIATTAVVSTWNLINNVDALNIESNLMSFDASNSRIGIGTAAPGLKLDVQDSQDATAAAQIYNTSTNTGADGLIIKLGNTSTTVVSSTNHFISFETAGIGIVGSVQGNGGTGVTYATSGIADFAEYFKKDPNQNVEFGSVMCLNESGFAVLCNSLDNKILGVASARPAFLGGENLGDRSVAVGLVGQVRTRVSTANGEIKIGDPLTSSSIPGVAVKATTVGQILGKAIEPFGGEGVGEILVSVNITWYNPSVFVSYDGTLAGMATTVASIGDQLTLQGATLASASAQLAAKTDYVLENDPLFQGLKDKVTQLESKLDLLSLQFEQQASISAYLTEIVNTQVLGASTSAELNLGDVEIDNATITDNLMVLGHTTVTSLGVTGNINAGLLSIHGLDGEINTLAGDLYLQKNALGAVNIFDGLIVMDTAGNLKAAGTITAKAVEAENYTVLGQESIGSATIPAGATSVEVNTGIATSSSKIFLTTTSLTDKQITVVAKSDGKFKVAIPSPTSAPITFDWWIVGNKNN